MESKQERTTYDIGSACAMLAVLIILLVMMTGCANMTVVKLATLCHSHDGHPAVTFNGDAGRVDCHQ